MSCLEELLQTLCPDGVEYTRLGDVSSVVRGVTYSKSAEVSSTDGYKILRANNISLDSNTINFDDVRIISDSVKVNPDQKLKENDIFICTASGSKDHVGKVAYIYHDLDYYFGGFMAVIRTKPTMLSRFLFHLLIGFSFSTYLKNTLNSSTINNLNSTILNGFRVPIPPLPVQKEIVRILDTFSDVVVELEAEQEARVKQYEYYRDELLSFDSKSKIIEKLLTDSWGKKVEILSINDVFKTITPPKKLNRDQYRENGTIPIIDQGQNTTVGYTDDLDASLPKNSYVLFGDHTRIIKFVDFPFAQGADGLKILLPKSNKYLPKYLYYAFLNANVESHGYSRHWAYAKKISIPVPPLEVQEKIVSILDRFDTLVNDLKSGLPAEIALRRKQYEYYRDKLLSFEPIE